MEGVSANPKILSHFFALSNQKQTNANVPKGQKQWKSYFWKFLLKNFGKSDSKSPKAREKYHEKQEFFVGWLP